MSPRRTNLRGMVLLLALVLILPAPSRAVPGAIAQSTPGEMIEFLGSIGGSITALDVSGSFAYIGEGIALTILDIHDPARPVRLGSAPLPGLAYQIQVVGRLAYVIIGQDNSSLLIIDISDSSQPRVRAHYPGTRKVHVSAERAYAVGREMYGGLLRIIDVSNPAAPRLLGSYADPYSVLYDIQVADTIGYAAGSGGVLIFDVGNPASPSVIGRYEGDGAIDTIQLVGQRLYVAGYYGLKIVDVSRPAAPMLLGRYAIAGEAWYLHVDGSYAYITTTNAIGDVSRGFLVIDIANPATPTPQGFYAAPGAIRKVRVIGQRAYLAIGTFSIQGGSYGALDIVDLSDPSKPTGSGRYTSTGAGLDVQVLGNLAYIAMDTAGLQIVGTDWYPGGPYPPSLSPKGSYAPPAQALMTLQISDGVAYVTSRDALWLIDVRNPARPNLILSFGVGRSDYRVHPQVQVIDQLAYIVYPNGEDYTYFTIISVRDRSHPTFLSHYYLPGDPLTLQIVGSLAYIGTTAGSLKIIDVSDPSHPTLRGTYQTPEQMFSIRVIDTYAYIISEIGTLEIVDVGDPANPILLGSYTAPGGIVDAQVVEGRAYLVLYPGGLPIGEGTFEIIDLRDPTAPISLAQWTLQMLSYNRLIVDGDRVYLIGSVHYGPGSNGGGILIMDVRNPTSPTPLGDYRMEVIESLEVAGDLLYVTRSDGYLGYSGVEIIDASDPSNLTQRAGYELPPYTYQMVVIDDLAYVAGSNGLYILNLHTDLLNATATIAPEGGSLAVLNGSLHLDVPAGAVASTTVITYTGLLDPSHPVSPKYGLVRSFTLAGRTSDGQVVAQFGQPATLVISYTDSLLASRLISDEQRLNLLAWDGQGWEELSPCAGCIIDSIHNQVSVPVKDLSEYVLVGDRRTIFLPLVSR